MSAAAAPVEVARLLCVAAGQLHAARGALEQAAEQAVAASATLANEPLPAQQTALGELTRALQSGDAVSQQLAHIEAQLQELALLLRENEVIDEAVLLARARGRCASAAERAVFDAAVASAAAAAHDGDVEWF